MLATRSTHTETGYDTLTWIVVLCAVGNGLVFPTWMAAFSETVERRNAGAVAAGLAVWSMVNKVVVSLVLLAFTLAITAPSVLIDKGTRVQQLTHTYARQLDAAAHGDPLAMARIPTGDLAFLRANTAAVERAQADGPRQWRRWWWICVAGQLLFLSSVFALAGRWRPQRARDDLRAHDHRIKLTLQDPLRPVELPRK